MYSCRVQVGGQARNGGAVCLRLVCVLAAVRQARSGWCHCWVGSNSSELSQEWSASLLGVCLVLAAVRHARSGVLQCCVCVV